MTHTGFLSLLKSRLKENALKYLLEKRKSKGKEIIYPDLEMADYLLPMNDELTIEEKDISLPLEIEWLKSHPTFQNLKLSPFVYVAKLKV